MLLSLTFYTNLRHTYSIFILLVAMYEVHLQPYSLHREHDEIHEHKRHYKMYQSDYYNIEDEYNHHINQENAIESEFAPFSQAETSDEDHRQTDIHQYDETLNESEEAEEELLEEYDHNLSAQEYSRPHYALDQHNAIRLAQIEQKINTTLTVISFFETRDTIPSNDLCYYSIKRYLENYDQDSLPLNGTSGFNRAHKVASNPLLLYRMIRRIVRILKDEVLIHCQNDKFSPEASEAIETVLANAEVSLPEIQDLDDALLGILRIQYVYGYNATSEIRYGIFGSIPTNVTLNFEDCYELGNKALELNVNIMAYQWFQAAELALNDVDSKIKEEATKELDVSYAELEKQAKIRRPQLDNIYKKIRQEIWEPSMYEYKRYATCRGEHLVDEEEKSYLFCHSVRTNPYWMINPVKIEQLSSYPPVWQVHDFIGDSTIEYIKKTAFVSFVRSGVMSNKKTRTEFSNYRTSMQTWIYDDTPGRVLETENLYRRIELLFNLEVRKLGASQALQVVAYSPLGGHYDFHTDSLSNPIITAADGDRLATMLMFLSDVQLGGHTAFPDIGLSVRPQKGSAILWYSQYLNGDPDPRSMHGGCPVVLGSKIAANKWILHHQNFLKFKCSLNPSE